jgi:predicted nucleic acid-binding protein
VVERNARRDVALAWKESIYEPGAVRIHPCELGDLARSWDYFHRRKLSAVDATSFVIMTRIAIRLAFTFDHHFAAVGFRLVG